MINLNPTIAVISSAATGTSGGLWDSGSWDSGSWDSEVTSLLSPSPTIGVLSYTPASSIYSAITPTASTTLLTPDTTITQSITPTIS